VSSETSAIKSQTPGNYPKRNKLHLQHGESLRTRCRHYLALKYQATLTHRNDITFRKTWDNTAVETPNFFSEAFMLHYRVDTEFTFSYDWQEWDTQPKRCCGNSCTLTNSVNSGSFGLWGLQMLFPLGMQHFHEQCLCRCATIAVFVVKMILPSTGHKMNFWQHHEQFRKFILEHTSIPRKRKPLKIFYFLYYTSVKPKAKTYTAETH